VQFEWTQHFILLLLRAGRRSYTLVYFAEAAMESHFQNDLKALSVGMSSWVGCVARPEAGSLQVKA